MRSYFSRALDKKHRPGLVFSVRSFRRSCKSRLQPRTESARMSSIERFLSYPRSAALQRLWLLTWFDVLKKHTHRLATPGRALDGQRSLIPVLSSRALALVRGLGDQPQRDPPLMRFSCQKNKVSSALQNLLCHSKFLVVAEDMTTTLTTTGPYDLGLGLLQEGSLGVRCFRGSKARL